MVKRLEGRLDELAGERYRRDPRGEPMTGAAGGLSGGLWARRGARLVPRRRLRARRDRLRRARCGSRPSSSPARAGSTRRRSQGKIVGEVATRCRQGGVTCHAIVGSNALDPFDERIIDLASVTEATNLEEMEAAARALV